MTTRYLRVACEVFTNEGFDTTFEHSGEEALSALSVSQPDLLLSDIRMKTRLDVFRCWSWCRRDYSGIPVVLMTVHLAQSRPQSAPSKRERSIHQQALQH